MAISLIYTRDFLTADATGSPRRCIQAPSVCTTVTAGVAGAGTIKIWCSDIRTGTENEFTLSSTYTDCLNAQKALLEAQMARDMQKFAHLDWWDYVPYQDNDSPPVDLTWQLTYPKA